MKRFFCSSPARRRIAKSKSDRELRRRRVPKNPYELVSGVKYLDLPTFENKRAETNRSEADLLEYFDDLYKHLQLKNDSIPVDPQTGTLEEIEYDDFWESEEEPWEKILTEVRERFPDEVAKNSKTMEQIINFSPLVYKNETEPPKLKEDHEYPDWLWRIAKDREVYSLADLSRIPFENLSQREKWRLLRVWRATMATSNSMWKNTLGRNNGRVRENYDDPWPEPITRQDYWGGVEEQEDIYTLEELPREQQRMRKRPRPEPPKESTRTPGTLYNHVDRQRTKVAFFVKPLKWRSINNNGPGSLRATMNSKKKNNNRRR